MHNRIREILSYSGLNQIAFSKKICVAPATLSNILNGKSKSSLEIVQNIRLAFPEINLFWLLDGVGSMLSTDASVDSPSVPSANSEITSDLFSSNSKDNSSLFSPVHASTPSSNFVLPEKKDKAESLQMVKIIDKPFRKVKEIQVFYDDDTYEVFVPRKS